MLVTLDILRLSGADGDSVVYTCVSLVSVYIDAQDEYVL